MDDRHACVEVERLGGFAGFGLPGARLRSRGEVAAAALSAADHACVKALFARPPDGAAASGAADGFRYRLTRHGEGRTQSIEVDEQHVPAVLRECVRDELV